MRSPDRLRVAMTCARFPPMVGGTEVHIANVGARLAARGHEVTVFTTALGDEERGEMTVDDMTVHRLRAWPAKSDLYVTPEMRGRVRDGDFDVVHVQGYHTFVAPAAMSGAAAAGVPFVVTFHSGGHSSSVRRAIRPLQQRLLKRQLSKAARLIGVSDFESEYFRTRLGLDADRFLTITNGVDDVFARAQPTQDRPIVSSVGRLERYKGHHRVIAAFAEVRETVPDAVLRIIGTGPYEATLRTLVRDRGLDDAVEFVSAPFGDRGAMARLLADSRVVALASSYESQGIVGLESLAAGAALVVADGSALADLAAHDAVTVVDRDAHGDFVTAIRDRLDSPRPEPRPSFPNWDEVTEQVESVYLDVTDRASR